VGEALNVEAVEDRRALALPRGRPRCRLGTCRW
jgi:hypothetical protein